ncbi:FAD/NAD(P)-binding protein [Devosia sediminis]|uniref:FAD/NAD(P)-binding protein n=1 Tax=Devosia sediminis TaxID=2798801 RepID=A0A934J178_9HYPH|nr:FAD/NAD(P)-binding protein [Devosia sediminis]MBJ3787076.1 FAD/NAD(P)-binding protein [Devosia sediminis]
MAKKKRVALVGGGPTAVYTLKNLLQKADGLHVTIFEAGKVAGCGIPYSDEFNTPDMMANITSVEIPPVMTSLADWVRSADRRWLSKFGVRRDKVSDRDYYPRVLLGAYYVDQLEQMIRTAAPWHQVDVKTETRVLDIIPDGKGFELTIANKEGKSSRRFNAVVLATGHLIEPTTSRASSRLYRSPYPVGNLELARDEAADPGIFAESHRRSRGAGWAIRRLRRRG